MGENLEGSIVSLFPFEKHYVTKEKFIDLLNKKGNGCLRNLNIEQTNKNSSSMKIYCNSLVVKSNGKIDIFLFSDKEKLILPDEPDTRYACKRDYTCYDPLADVCKMNP